MAFTGELSPSAGLGGVLLDRLELPVVHLECCGSQALRTGSSYSADFAIEVDLGAVKQLLGYGLEHGMVQHLRRPARRKALQTLLLSIADAREKSLTTHANRNYKVR
jgi:hypothetical protein